MKPRALAVAQMGLALPVRILAGLRGTSAMIPSERFSKSASRAAARNTGGHVPAGLPLSDCKAENKAIASEESSWNSIFEIGSSDDRKTRRINKGDFFPSRLKVDFLESAKVTCHDDSSTTSDDQRSMAWEAMSATGEKQC